MKEHLIANSWNDFLEKIKIAKSSFRDPEQVWFRGQSNASYSLLPTLMRASSGLDKEALAFRKFVQSSYRVFHRRGSDWETLFDMQHYGLPTRLTDWSETLGIATFFAVNYRASGANDAAVYLLDPIALNEYSGLDRIPFIPEDQDFEYKKIYWEKRPFAPKYPIAIQPLFQNDRIFAQSGMFTVHGDDTSPIEKLCPKAVKRVVLTENAIVGAHEFLEIANINSRTVFPDMYGVANHIKKILAF
ncbi:FRG domain-containing protein [Rhizobium leguminosarum]|uniref:FRG domain-containing protein n=1 Tax=Rhizobium leguminosarum TaxID=384 RepID=UPI001C97EA88|nr:FRG domain-containing protein [Rhizobium leguminosarum]MBY5827112.1 FRG domain-containing protein [Rhizobium leguminosarum]